MRWTPCGPCAVLIEFPEHIGARARAIEEMLVVDPTVADFAIAFDKLLIEFVPGTPVDAAHWLRRLEALPISANIEPTTHEIPVVYDGPDLIEVAERHGLTREELIELHSTPVYEVALLGFAPGFPYLSGLDSRLHTPRRANPRPTVPAGAVAIGGSHAGIYSVPTPGGWNLIGMTNARLFDPQRREPDESAMFLLRPGDRVKFTPVP
jgi:TIGR00370 family protein